MQIRLLMRVGSYSMRPLIEREDMAVVKKKLVSSQELVEAIERFVPLLAGQNEDEAVQLMRELIDQLREQEAEGQQFKDAVQKVIEAFDGELELIAYTLKSSDGKNWSEADELAVVSNRVLALARRLR